MLKTDICWHEFANEKPEKEGVYFVFRKYGNNYFISQERYSDRTDYPHLHFEETTYDNYGEWGDEVNIDSDIYLWAELEPMKEELKSYIFKEEK